MSACVYIYTGRLPSLFLWTCLLLTVYLLIRYVVQTLTVLRVVVLGDTCGVDVGLGGVEWGVGLGTKTCKQSPLDARLYADKGAYEKRNVALLFNIALLLRYCEAQGRL